MSDDKNKDNIFSIVAKSPIEGEEGIADKKTRRERLAVVNFGTDDEDETIIFQHMEEEGPVLNFYMILSEEAENFVCELVATVNMNKVCSINYLHLDDE